MKKFLSVLIILSMLSAMVCLASCGEKSVDEQFNEAYVQGLDARWQQVYSAGGNSDDISLEEDASYVEAELQYIDSFKDKTFENEELGKLAKEYIKNLESFLAISDDMNKTDYHNQWTQTLLNREIIMSKMDPYLKVEFDDSVEQNAYDSMIEEGTIASLEQNFKFEISSEQYGVKEYVTEVKNTTDIDFKHFTIDITLLDKDGKTVGTEHSYTTNWTAGSTHRFSFSTKKDFADYKIVNYDFAE